MIFSMIGFFLVIDNFSSLLTQKLVGLSLRSNNLYLQAQVNGWSEEEKKRCSRRTNSF